MKILQKTYYLRDREGKFVAAISKVRVIAFLALLGIAIAGTAHSALTAPKLIEHAPEVDYLTQALEKAEWATTGTQEIIQGNVIMGPCDKTCDPNAEAIYLGDDAKVLYRFREWEMKDIRKQLESWKEKSGEPTAILSRVCRQNGINGTDCPKTLYAMAQHESYFGKVMQGDGGRSQGFFHIMDYNKVPKSCSYDLECSADWTLKRMIRYGYKTNPDVAVMAHNGTPNTPATLHYLAVVNQKKSLWPGSN